VSVWVEEWNRITEDSPIPPWVNLIVMYNNNAITWTQCERQLANPANGQIPYGTIVLTSYNTFGTRLNALSRQNSRWGPIAANSELFSRLICDEAHILRTGLRGEYKIIRNSRIESFFALTATPLVRTLDDLRKLLQLFPCEGFEAAELRNASAELQKEMMQKRAQMQLNFPALNIGKEEPILSTDDEETIVKKNEANARIRSRKAKHQEACRFLEYRSLIQKQHPPEDVYVLSEHFWEAQGLSKNYPAGDPQWRVMGTKVSYILMQIMLRRELTGRLSIPPENKFQRFLDIPRMEVTTVPVTFSGPEDRLYYTNIASQIQIAKDSGDEERSSSLHHLYKAGLSPVTIDTIRTTQGNSKVLWSTTIDGYPDTDNLFSCDSLFSKENLKNLLPNYDNEDQELDMKVISNWSAKTRRAFIHRMLQGSPKLRNLRRRLMALERDGQEKLLVWCHYPVSQWTLTLVSCCRTGPMNES